MVKSGDSAGNITEVLELLADQLKKRLKMKKTIMAMLAATTLTTPEEIKLQEQCIAGDRNACKLVKCINLEQLITKTK